MFKRFYDWLLPIRWPTVLVGWKQLTPDFGLGIKTLAATMAIPAQMLYGRDANVCEQGFRRWPSMDEAIQMDLMRMYKAALTRFEWRINNQLTMEEDNG